MAAGVPLKKLNFLKKHSQFSLSKTASKTAVKDSVLSFILVFTIFSLSSCSVFTRSVFRTIDNPREMSGSPQAPLNVSLANAYIIEKTILLKIQIEVLHDLSARDTVVGVLGLKEGAVIEEQYMVLSDVVSKTKLGRGERIQLEYSLESGILTEFQIKVFWGEEGKKVFTEKISMNDIFETGTDKTLSITPPEVQEKKTDNEVDIQSSSPDLLPPEPRKPAFPDISGNRKTTAKALTINRVEVHEDDIPCEKAPCPKKIKVKGVLTNTTTHELSSVRLAFGLFWVSDGKLPSLPDDQEPKKPAEEELFFAEKIFSPGESVEFDIAIGRPVYQIPGGTFMPHIRVLSYE